MEISGICPICGKQGKMYPCQLCGSRVCSECYHHQRGVCRLCRRGLRMD
ncbi:MAG: orotate phosphoribosyltransferase [Euryarchaeota archaeon]|nr:orotate phosphoribosyltransferase [Euryarchaeota archaeon]HNS25199.1 orotate phosphoribosyltransferase [Methanobacteriaceae archaeon]